jgi:hypothetical protein
MALTNLRRPAMKRTIPLFAAIALLSAAATAQAQRWSPPPVRAPNISGVWYMNGDPYKDCEIRQGPDGRAVFTNENGDSARGTVRGDQVWIPDWMDGRRQGLRGVIRGDRIVWPDGTFWSR